MNLRKEKNIWRDTRVLIRGGVAWKAAHRRHAQRRDALIDQPKVRRRRRRDDLRRCRSHGILSRPFYFFSWPFLTIGEYICVLEILLGRFAYTSMK